LKHIGCGLNASISATLVVWESARRRGFTSPLDYRGTDFFTTADSLASDRLVGVVDLRAGRVLAQWRGRMPQLLAGGCCDEPSGW
jgi:hypothetical protein